MTEAAITANDMDLILEETCKFFGIMTNAVKCKSRKREIVEARQSSMYMMKEVWDIGSLKSIGLFHGGRDHSTVIHALITINDLIDTDREFKLKIIQLRKNIIKAKEEKEKKLDEMEMLFKFEFTKEVVENLESYKEAENQL